MKPLWNTKKVAAWALVIPWDLAMGSWSFFWCLVFGAWCFSQNLPVRNTTVVPFPG